MSSSMRAADEVAPVPDAALVEAVLEGDREAYGALVRRYERAVRAVALGVLGNGHACRDVAQEALIKAFERLGDLRDPAAFGPWLMAIARRSAVDHVRRTNRETPAGMPADLPLGLERPPVDEGPALMGAVERLADSERQVVLLRFFGDHSVTEVAAILGRSVGTVTKQLSRAYERLRGILEEPRR